MYIITYSIKGKPPVTLIPCSVMYCFRCRCNLKRRTQHLFITLMFSEDINHINFKTGHSLIKFGLLLFIFWITSDLYCSRKEQWRRKRVSFSISSMHKLQCLSSIRSFGCLLFTFSTLCVIMWNFVNNTLWSSLNISKI